MLSFNDISKLFARNLENKFCLEINFTVNGYSDYQDCWMGKTPDQDDKNKEVYWFGLASDGSKAYDYNNFKDFSNEPVFDGKSLKELWNDIEILSINGCEPEIVINFYI